MAVVPVRPSAAPIAAFDPSNPPAAAAPEGANITASTIIITITIILNNKVSYHFCLTTS